MKIHTTALLATIGGSAWNGVSTTEGLAFSTNSRRAHESTPRQASSHERIMTPLHSTQKGESSDVKDTDTYRYNRGSSGAMEAELRAKAAERRVAILQNQLKAVAVSSDDDSSSVSSVSDSDSPSSSSNTNDDDSAAADDKSVSSSASAGNEESNNNSDDVNGGAENTPAVISKLRGELANEQQVAAEIKNRLLDMEDKFEFEQMDHSKERKELRGEVEKVQSAREKEAKIASDKLDNMRIQMEQDLTNVKDEAKEKQLLMEQEYQKQLHQKEESIDFLQGELKGVSKKFADEMRGRERDAADASEKMTKLREDLTRQIIDTQKDSAERILALQSENKKKIEDKNQVVSALEQDVFDREQQIFQLESEQGSFRSIAKTTFKLTGKRIRNVFRRKREKEEDE